VKAKTVNGRERNLLSEEEKKDEARKGDGFFPETCGKKTHRCVNDQVKRRRFRKREASSSSKRTQSVVWAGMDSTAAGRTGKKVERKGCG